MALTNSNSAVRKHLTDIHEWQRMGEANIFTPESHIELIDGEIWDMPPRSCNHAGHVMCLNSKMYPLLLEMAIISVHNPLQLGNFSEPEPDFMLLKPHTDFYSSRHPVASDVLLLVEVADSSLNFDQNEKLHLYARHNIPEYWVLNLIDSTLEVYREPSGEQYAQKTTLRTGDSLTLTQLPEITVKVAEIL